MFIFVFSYTFLGNDFFRNFGGGTVFLLNELPSPPRPSRWSGTDAGVRDAWVGPTPWDQEEAGFQNERFATGLELYVHGRQDDKRR